MTNIENLRTKYMQDTEAKSTKQRLGFFSLPPSARAANTEYLEKKGNEYIDSKPSKMTMAG